MVRIALICICLISLYNLPARAEEQEEPSDPKVIDGVDPTVFVIRADLKNIYDYGPDGTHVNTTLLRGDYVIKRVFKFRVDVPFVYANVPGSDSKYGLGDVALRLGGLIAKTKYVAVAAGWDFYFDTASAQVLGSGKYFTGPLFLTAFYATPWFTIVTPFIKYRKAYAGDNARPDINSLEIETDLQFALPSEWWAELQPKVIVDFADSNRGTFLVEAEVGKMITKHIGLWLHPGGTIVGKRPFDFTIEAGFRYLIKY